MRDTNYFSFLGGPPSAGADDDLGRFARLAKVGESVCHQLTLPSDLPTKVGY